MILSDREIKAAISRGSLFIDPVPSEEAWTSTAVDLRLGNSMRCWKQVGDGAGLHILPAQDNFNYQRLYENHTEDLPLDQERGYEIVKGRFYLGWTFEKIKLPHHSRIAARVEGKSSLARLGLGVHVTAPTIHAGFGDRTGTPGYTGNPLQLEISNINHLPVYIKPGMLICQLIFEEVHGTPEQGYKGRFA